MRGGRLQISHKLDLLEKLVSQVSLLRIDLVQLDQGLVQLLHQGCLGFFNLLPLLLNLIFDSHLNVTFATDETSRKLFLLRLILLLPIGHQFGKWVFLHMLFQTLFLLFHLLLAFLCDFLVNNTCRVYHLLQVLVQLSFTVFVLCCEVAHDLLTFSFRRSEAIWSQKLNFFEVAHVRGCFVI